MEKKTIGNSYLGLFKVILLLCKNYISQIYFLPIKPSVSIFCLCLYIPMKMFFYYRSQIFMNNIIFSIAIAFGWKTFLKFLKLCECVYICGGYAYISAGALGGQRHQIPEARVTGSCELLHVGSGNSTRSYERVLSLLSSCLPCYIWNELLLTKDMLKQKDSY